MTPLTVQRAINQLRRDRLNLLSSIKVHDLANNDPLAVSIFAKIKQGDDEILELEQMYSDLIHADILGKKGAAAVIEACKIMGAKP